MSERFATPADVNRKFVIFFVTMSETTMEICEDSIRLSRIGSSPELRFGGWGAIDKVRLGEPQIHSWSSFSYYGYIIDYVENREEALKRANKLIQIQKAAMLNRLAVTTERINKLELLVKRNDN